MQNIDDASKASKGATKSSKTTFARQTVPKEHANYVFYPILE
tara:strand:- start:791 stop:916 length:126 start_codon:yes stop_codon:yes gene_type:complete